MIYYKYGGDSTLQIFENLRLKITPPNEFNDPFEITPHSMPARLKEMLGAARENPASFQNVYDNMKAHGDFNGSFQDFTKGLGRALSHFYPQYKKSAEAEFSGRDLAAVDEVSKNMGVLCLSQIANSIPMWSYYGNHHRGVAVGIDVNRLPVAQPKTQRMVCYRKRRVKLKPFLWMIGHPSNEERIKALFTKSHEWSHEKEFRRIFYLGDLMRAISPMDKTTRYFLDISGQEIRRIIFGCRINPTLENAIRQELHRRPKTFGHIQLFRAERHRSKYQLTILPC